MFNRRHKKVAQTGPASYHVTLSIFSGVPDPKWIFDCPSQRYQYIETNLPTQSTPLSSILGYRGFIFDEYQGSQMVRRLTMARRANPSFEKGLLDMIKGMAAVGDSEPMLTKEWVNKMKEDIDGND